jgi:predicted dehydrogenase
VTSRQRIGVGLIGFGWLGHAHSRSLLRIPTLFPERGFDVELVICADTAAARRDEVFGYGEVVEDWRRVVEHPGVDAVFIAAPNMLHLDVIEAAAGRAIFCEKPVGGTPEQTERAANAAGEAITGVGYNYRWAPLVQYAAQLIGEGRLGEITNYRGRFLSTYGSDPLGPLTWRYRRDAGGYGASSDLLSHAVDLAMMLLGPITRVVGAADTFIGERPGGSVTNEDYAALLCEFASGARGSFESSRTIVGPESQMAFDVHGTRGAIGWNLERMNELQVYLAEDAPHTGYRTVYGGERFPYHGRFVPGSANGIGFEDLVVIEDYEFCRSVAEGRPHVPGFAEAVAFVRVQEAFLESCRTGRWEVVR